MAKQLPKSKMYRYCLADIAKGLFTGMISNYLLYFFQPTVKSGIPQLLPQNKLLGYITIMALITGLGKIVDAVTDPMVASLSDRCTHKSGRRMPFLRGAAIPYALSVLLIFYVPFPAGSVLNAVWVGFFLISYYTAYTFPAMLWCRRSSLMQRFVWAIMVSARLFSWVPAPLCMLPPCL